LSAAVRDCFFISSVSARITWKRHSSTVCPGKTVCNAPISAMSLSTRKIELPRSMLMSLSWASFFEASRKVAIWAWSSRYISACITGLPQPCWSTTASIYSGIPSLLTYGKIATKYLSHMSDFKFLYKESENQWQLKFARMCVIAISHLFPTVLILHQGCRSSYW